MLRVYYKRKYNIYELFENKTLNFLNPYHLGDNIFFSLYVQKLEDHFRNENIHINYYIDPKNIEHIREFMPSDIVTLHPLDTAPSDTYNEWIGPTFSSHFHLVNSDFIGFLNYHFNQISEKLHLPKFDSLVTTNPSLLSLYETLDPACKVIDVLIINAIPNSGQYHYNKEEWDEFCKYIASKYNTITTERVDGLKCTRDYNLTLKGIGALSTHVNYIIAVNSGPIVPCLNTHTFTHMRHMYVFDNNTKYNHPKITNVTRLDEVKKLL